jgi:hypothetical protein
VKTDLGTYDPDWWKHGMSWMGLFVESSCWGAALGEWIMLERIAAYPTNECPVDSNFTRDDKNLFLAIASSLRREPASRTLQYLERLKLVGRRETSFQGRVLKSVVDGDSHELNQQLNEYLAYYKKHEFPHTDLTLKVCMLGTFFYHLARHSGLEPNVHASYRDHIVILS